MAEFHKNNMLWVEKHAISKANSLDAGFVEFDVYTHNRGRI